MLSKKWRTSAPPNENKARTGITGLDEITLGGLARGRATLLAGGAGSGKSMLALQTLVNGARHYNEPGIFVAFEESSERIVANAANFGWDLKGLQRKKLFFLDAQPTADLIQSGSFDLDGLLEMLAAKAREIKAKRIVFDSVEIVLSLLQNANAERREILKLHEWRGNILTFRPKRRRIKNSLSNDTNILIQRAAAELKTAGAREIYVFGSAAKGTGDAASDLDLAVSGLPPSVFYRMGARVSDLIGRSVDLIDLDISTPFTRHLRTENELVRVG